MPIRPISNELQEVAIKELNEVPSRVQGDLNHIREWISQQPHLRARTDDQWLLAFLRSSKFSLQRTKEKIDAFYTVRNFVPELHENRDPFSPELQEILNAGPTLILPKTAHPAAPRVMFTRGSKLNYDTMTLMNHLKLSLMMVEILMLEDDNFVVTGVSTAWDLNNFSYSYTTQATPVFLKKLVMYIVDVYPLRFKEVNYFNAPSFFVAIYNLFKNFAPEKLKNRIFLSKDDNFESSSLTRSVIPNEYGGEGGYCDELRAYWKKKVESYRDWFLEDAQYGTDESKRLGKSKVSHDLFGPEGSFIKLQID